jgi:hypothetical protein
MFGQGFYFQTIRKYVILVGTLFNDIRVTKENKTGKVVSIVKVPVTYAPKDKMLARVLQDPNIDRDTATITLPLISFEMGQIKYDGTRKLNTIVKSSVKFEPSNFKYQYNPVPYNFNFKVYIYAKHAEDGTKIIEQILPYFTPDWTTTVKLIPEMSIIMDIPVILNDIRYEDKYDSDFKERRAIVWTLDLTLKGYIYGPVKKSGIIKFVNTTFYIPDVPDGTLADSVGNTSPAERVTVQPGLLSNGSPVSWYGAANSSTGTIPYAEIEANNDFGYITQIYNTDELE